LAIPAILAISTHFPNGIIPESKGVTQIISSGVSSRIPERSERARDLLGDSLGASRPAFQLPTYPMASSQDLKDLPKSSQATCHLESPNASEWVRDLLRKASHKPSAFQLPKYQITQLPICLLLPFLRENN
jgi:hypothetical protein